MPNDPELMRVLGRMEGKLDSVMTQLASHVISDEKSFHEHDYRINKVERKQSWFMGGLAALTFIVGMGALFIRMGMAG